ncbi:MAG TPA: TIGR00282 family metallophosphoesterase [bacterium]|nr:TIGR00282 family metallophosphoesterase [bacterium]
MSFNVLMVGDIVGRPGRKILTEMLPRFRADYSIHFAVVNAENAASGKGITKSIAEDFLSLGADVLTLGNHVWDNKDILGSLDNERLLRPANYPPVGVPGHGVFRCQLPSGVKITVVHLMGRVFMTPIDCPFRTMDKILEEVAPGEIVLVDFHAEATSEKKALACYLDGRVSVLCGTHTHVQTADEQILPNGTAFISDIGMTGPHAGIIGMRSKEILERFLTQMPAKYEVGEGDEKFQALFVQLNEQTGKAVTVERINFDVQQD